MIGLIPWILPAQETVHYFQPLCVTASRLVSSLSSETRSLEVLDHDEIVRLPVSSVPELLQYIGGVDMQQRGPAGVQADFSLRGSGFEQVLVLLDGVRLNDPQTGHHNADIPASLTDIERIEVLHGHASSMYGPDGYGGVINIITRNAGGTNTRAAFEGGSFGTVGARIGQSLKAGQISGRLNLERRKSNGYRPVTDYDNSALSGSLCWERPHRSLQFTGGGVIKDFGANGFYADYPSREKTRAVMGILNASFHPHRFQDWNLRIHGRRHTDHFILDKTRPDWYRNDHTTNAFGLETRFRFHITQTVQSALGAEWISEALESSSLGDHRQQRMGFYAEIAAPFMRTGLIDGGIRLDHHARWGTVISPSVNGLVRISESVKWRAAAGRIFRAPTFTEQYYQSPANIGDPALDPEKGWSAETGLDVRVAGLLIENTFFLRHETNRIDWIADQPGDPWRAVNTGRMQTAGLCLSLKPCRIPAWHLNYTVLDRTGTETAVLSKYEFRLLKSHLQLHTLIPGPWKIRQSWNLDWKKRQHEDGVWILSVKLMRTIRAFTFFAEGRNLFGSEYAEILNIPMPGRNFTAGFHVEMGRHTDTGGS